MGKDSGRVDADDVTTTKITPPSKVRGVAEGKSIRTSNEENPNRDCSIAVNRE